MPIQVKNQTKNHLYLISIDVDCEQTRKTKGLILKRFGEMVHPLTL